MVRGIVGKDPVDRVVGECIAAMVEDSLDG